MCFKQTWPKFCRAPSSFPPLFRGSCDRGEQVCAPEHAGAGGPAESDGIVTAGGERRPGHRQRREGEAAQGLGVEGQALPTHEGWLRARP